MSNIQRVQASFIQRKVQKEYEQSGRDWLDIIEEEIEKIKNERRWETWRGLKCWKDTQEL